ncbi:hypothetical protein E4A41_03415 [Micrococcus endophyticus]|nr:hypothetical protein E4A41_03415 [Micrococcus endophyticus]
MQSHLKPEEGRVVLEGDVAGCDSLLIVDEDRGNGPVAELDLHPTCAGRTGVPNRGRPIHAAHWL